MSRRSLAALSAAVLLVLTGCSDDDGDTAEDQPNDPDAAECQYPEAGEPAKEVQPPDNLAADAGDVSVTIETSAGQLDATLDGAAAPCTVNSFTSLAGQGYFDGTTCHRLTTEGILVLQCGDPTASGMGGPGYTIPDEVDGEETYPAGTLAMAKTSQPDSGGSQFFVVYDDTELPPEYTVFGTIDEASIEAVRAVAAEGTAEGGPDGAPKTPVEIESVSIG
ncbi:MAG TPA: peptidylprolyl isomerase [Nocardioides sp.]|nr:peptidylprolyl isomerase [Nocardioides sp.]